MLFKFYRITTVLLLSIIAVCFTHCGKPTPLVFSDSAFNESDASDSQLAFYKSVYPITRKHCISCHEVQEPVHAHEDVKKAHDALISMGKVDFRNLSASRLIQKIKVDEHNCWGDCQQNAQELEEAVELWSQSVTIPEGDVVVPPIPEPVPGTTTGGVPPVTSLEAFTAYMYPVTRNNCIGCHTVQSPRHAADDVQRAHDDALRVVSFDAPTESRIIQKMSERHNCGSVVTCGNIADQFLNAIVEWKKIRNPGETTGSTAGGSTGGTTGMPAPVPPAPTTSLEAYKAYMYPISRNNCMGCHTVQVPRHASDDVQRAHDESLSVTNFSIPSASEIVRKMDEGHNCGSSTRCISIANEFIAAITEWKKVRDTGTTTGSATTGGSTTGSTTGTTTGGSTTGTTTGGTTTGTTTGGSTTGGTTTPPSSPTTSLQAYETYMYPISRNNCIGCHTAQSPRHASDDVQRAHDESLRVVSFTNPSASTIVSKMGEGHNCGSSTKCSSIASQFVAAITEWKKVRDTGTTTGSTTTGGATTGSTTGTTTGGSTTGTTTGGTTTGGTTGTPSTPPANPKTSLEAYAAYVYPISRNNCIGCHTTQSPRHASDDVLRAHNDSLTVVDFSRPSKSEFVEQMEDGHNCGSSTNCNKIANDFISAITEWKKVRDASGETAASGGSGEEEDDD